MGKGASDSTGARPGGLAADGAGMLIRAIAAMKAGKRWGGNSACD
jgi:hypothetical protein